MHTPPTAVRRATAILDFTDEDSLVTEDTFDPDSGKRISRAVYRTSARPDGLRPPAERYLLAPDLPAALAVHPDCIEVVAHCVLASGETITVLFRSLLGDTAAQPIGTWTGGHCSEPAAPRDRHQDPDHPVADLDPPSARAARLLDRG